ncbi:uncharacterized protein AB675_7430, partial [Cyphellophora attinorum]
RKQLVNPSSSAPRHKGISFLEPTGEGGKEEEWEYECIMPEEGLQCAREMRVDRYAECSALTGELLWEATQDITRMAAGTTVDSGEKCVGM